MTPRRIVVTGASSGIGRALALRYARPGTTLALVARSAEGLAAVASACVDRGAEAVALPLDVRDRAELAAALGAFGDVDLLVANAGLSLPSPAEAPCGPAERAEIDVNLVGAMNAVEPVAAAMVRRRTGRIALMSSLAALAPLADAPAYSASKAALLAYGLALRTRLRPFGVTVQVVCPGYVTTAMSAPIRGWRPLEMSAERAAERIARGLAGGRAVVAFPGPLAALARVSTLVPEAVSGAVLRLLRFRIGEGPGRP